MVQDKTSGFWLLGNPVICLTGGVTGDTLSSVLMLINLNNCITVILERDSNWELVDDQ